MMFIKKNQEHIEEQYFISISVKNHAGSSLKKNNSNYFNSAKSFCNLILGTCKDEIAHVDQSPQHVLSRPMPENLTRKRRSSVKKEKFVMVDSQIHLKKQITSKKV